MKFFAYILKSQKTGNYYYGSTSDLDNRLNKHNQGKVKSTKARRPWIIQYVEEFNTRSEAAKREFFFKRVNGYIFLKAHNII